MMRSYFKWIQFDSSHQMNSDCLLVNPIAKWLSTWNFKANLLAKDWRRRSDFNLMSPTNIGFYQHSICHSILIDKIDCRRNYWVNYCYISNCIANVMISFCKIAKYFFNTLHYIVYKLNINFTNQKWIPLRMNTDGFALILSKNCTILVETLWQRNKSVKMNPRSLYTCT